MKPKIICHRGLWKEKNDHNTIDSCLQAVKNGFGVEIDLRFVEGRVVMSHDHGVYSKENDLEEFFRLIANYEATIFLDIKESGMGHHLKAFVDQYSNLEVFVFNQSIPDLILQSQLGLNVFARLSEFEEVNAELSNRSKGICIDLFEAKSSITDYIQKFNQKPLMVISPELHGRHYFDFWQTLKENSLKEIAYLCTDLPFEARDFFYS